MPRPRAASAAEHERMAATAANARRAHSPKAAALQDDPQFVRFIPTGRDPKTYGGVVGWLVRPSGCWEWQGSCRGRPDVVMTPSGARQLPTWRAQNPRVMLPSGQTVSVRLYLYVERYGRGSAPTGYYGDRWPTTAGCGHATCVNPEHAKEKIPNA